MIKAQLHDDDIYIYCPKQINSIPQNLNLREARGTMSFHGTAKAEELLALLKSKGYIDETENVRPDQIDMLYGSRATELTMDSLYEWFNSEAPTADDISK